MQSFPPVSIKIKQIASGEKTIDSHKAPMKTIIAAVFEERKGRKQAPTRSIRDALFLDYYYFLSFTYLSER